VCTENSIRRRREANVPSLVFHVLPLRMRVRPACMHSSRRREPISRQRRQKLGKVTMQVNPPILAEGCWLVVVVLKVARAKRGT
jgi:hypothetical protein